MRSKDLSGPLVCGDSLPGPGVPLPIKQVHSSPIQSETSHTSPEIKTRAVALAGVETEHSVDLWRLPVGREPKAFQVHESLAALLDFPSATAERL